MTKPLVHTTTADAGSLFEKVGCKVGTVWVGAGAAVDESGDSIVLECPRGSGGMNLISLRGLGFPVISKEIARRSFLQSG